MQFCLGAGLPAKMYLDRFKESIAHCIDGLFAEILRKILAAVSANALSSADLETVLGMVRACRLAPDPRVQEKECLTASSHSNKLVLLVHNPAVIFAA